MSNRLFFAFFGFFILLVIIAAASCTDIETKNWKDGYHVKGE